MSVGSESSDSASADKSTSSTITLANGQQITTYHPQQRFDLLEGDPALVGPGAADLVNLALSRTPDDGRLRVAFDALHAQLRDVFNYVPAEVQLDEPNTVHGPRQTAEGSDASVNWSGAHVGPPEHQFLDGVIARWVVPNIEARTPNIKEFMSCWIGIDDESVGGTVCQAGIGCDVLRTGDTETTSFYPFFEWFPAAQVKITNLPVSPGDTVFVTLRLDGDSQATATFVNETTFFDATSVTFTAPPGSRLSGFGAEWIVAAPTVGGQLSTLPSYGEVFFTDCVAFVSGFRRFKVRPRKGDASGSGQVGGGIDMQDESGTVSEGTVLTDTVVRCRYVGPGSAAKDP
jgi:Peptidase A4 family